MLHGVILKIKVEYFWDTVYHYDYTTTSTAAERVRNMALNFCPYFCLILTDFQNSFTDRLSK